MAEAPKTLSPDARRVIRLLRIAAEKCRRIVLNPPGGTESARAFASSRAAAQLAEINRELDQLKVVAVRVGNAEIERKYREGLIAAEKMAKDAGVRRAGSAVAGTFSRVDRRQAEVLSRDVATNLIKAIDSIKRVTGRVVRQTQALGLNDKKVNRIIAGGTIEGMPADTLRKLRKETRRIANGGFVETVNKTTGVVTRHRPDDYADLVYQTKTREATRIATAERLSERGIDLVKIIGSNSVNFCTHFVGKVYSISGKSTEYPALSSLPGGGPPFHPRCSKTIVAFILLLATPKQIDDSKQTAATRELSGKTAAEAQKIARQRKAA
ncbi:MAG: hypothetical protein H7Z14_14165 [Anaerolineae bacterium]|nr:hypothetical protein [Phycisphaerae bacterium]